jgi:hypothetical protein
LKTIAEAGAARRFICLRTVALLQKCYFGVENKLILANGLEGYSCSIS